MRCGWSDAVGAMRLEEATARRIESAKPLILLGKQNATIFQLSPLLVYAWKAMILRIQP